MIAAALELVQRLRAGEPIPAELLDVDPFELAEFSVAGLGWDPDPDVSRSLYLRVAALPVAVSTEVGRVGEERPQSTPSAVFLRAIVNDDAAALTLAAGVDVLDLALLCVRIMGLPAAKTREGMLDVLDTFILADLSRALDEDR